MKNVTRVFFYTSSQIKLSQYQFIFNDYGLKLITPSKLPQNITEPQLEDISDTEELIVAHPLKSMSRFVLKYNYTPLFIEDTMLVIDAFSRKDNSTAGLPGPDTKNWWKNLGNEGILHLLKNEKNRKSTFMCTIGVLIDKGVYCYATHKLNGSIAKNVIYAKESFDTFPKTNPYFFHQIFIPDHSSTTLANMNSDEFMTHDYRRQCAKKIYSKFIKRKQDSVRQLELF